MMQKTIVGKRVGSALNRDRLSYFQGLLLLKKQEALKGIESFSQSRKLELNVSQNGQVSDERVANHLADPSAKEKLISKNKNLINRISQALERVERGDYGVCAECGQPIDKKRLIARPFTKLCLSCKKKEESKENQLKGGNGTRRRHFSNLYA
ncbi:TraR/DksA family transcriptional regulator [Patescibacteria group bacterium]|nr:TraR/DksA family transcriptional regulator [Patescibacteria group bacterium]MBU2219968.1 TraR/DksA family transcriptional regulator [Patescibacteria group bacterium]